MKSLNFFILVILIVTGLSNKTFSQNPEKQFDKILSEQNFENSPGFTVLVAKNNQVIYRKAFGYANLELDVKLKPEHIFRIGSITKQFTASAILKLEEEGKLSLQDDITKFIKDYPTHGHTITIEHLLTHTSGIKSYTSMKEWDAEMRKKDFTPVEMIDFFKNQPMDFAPGEKFLYNNSAYFMLGYIIEKASGKTYEEYLKDTFFEPLDMQNSSYGNPSRVIKNRAAGYMKKNGEFVNAEFLSMTQPYAAGSLLSTVDDLFTWYTAVMNDKVISHENRLKAHSSFKLNNGKPTGYGYGWFLGNIQGSPMIEHGGGIHGYLTASLWLPEEKVFVAVFSNCYAMPPQSTAFKLAAAAIEKPFDRNEIEMNKKTLEDYVGVYESDEEETRTLLVENDSLFYVYPSGNREKLLPFEKDRFFMKNSFNEFIFKRNAQGEVVSLTASGTGYLPLNLKKTDKPVEVKQEVELPDELLDKYLGKYELMPEFILTVTREGKCVFVQATGQMKSEIFASEQHRFFSKMVNAEFIFHLDDNGDVTGLTLLQNGEHKAKKVE
ncbi:serine hydrolase [Mariniphaga sp.]|uniref:serine hydrolase n=1 Tax=Mariniphaga sp. TaxID=1954475 RepID=UPI00356277D2